MSSCAIESTEAVGDDVRGDVATVRRPVPMRYLLKLMEREASRRYLAMPFSGDKDAPDLADDYFHLDVSIRSILVVNVVRCPALIPENYRGNIEEDFLDERIRLKIWEEIVDPRREEPLFLVRGDEMSEIYVPDSLIQKAQFRQEVKDVRQFVDELDFALRDTIGEERAADLMKAVRSTVVDEASSHWNQSETE